MPLRARGKMKFHHIPVCGKKRFSPGSFRTISLGKGIKATVGCKKGQFRKGRCRVGTTVQRVMLPTDRYTFKQAKTWKRKRYPTCRL